MHTRIPHSFLPLLMVAAVLGLAACDSGAQDELQWEPGDQLQVRQSNAQNDFLSFDGFAPGVTYYYVVAHSNEWDYNWVVTPEAMSSERIQNGQFFRIDYATPGDFTVTTSTTIDGQDYSSQEATFSVTAPPIATQINRLAQFSDAEDELFGISGEYGVLNTAIQAAGVGGALNSPDSLDGPFTLLAPTQATLSEAFADGEDEGEELDLPGANVLGSILQYHTITDDVDLGDVSAGESFETLAGSEITFDAGGDNASVDGNAVTSTGLPISNGSLFSLDGLLLPPDASVDLNNQTSEDGVTLTVRSVYVPADGYVAIHDSTLLDNPAQVAGSVIGVSDYIEEAGVYNNLEVTLFDVPGADFADDMALDGNQQLIAMPHEETNGNTEYNFLTSGGDEDGAYTEDGSAVVDPAQITVGGQ